MKKQWTSHLFVDAGNPAVRIEVLDSDFNVTARGYHRLDETLPTGIYKVRYVAGDASYEKLVKLKPDDHVRLTDPPKLAFASAAPMEQTHTSREYHQAHAQDLSHAEPLNYGTGAELFLFVRDLVEGGRSHPMQGLTLHALDGSQLVDLEKESTRNEGKKEAQWAGCTISLNPGSYRLRRTVRRGPAMEMTVVACPDWQSQVFLLRINSQEEPNSFTPLDLSSATQLMAKPEKGFNPYLLSDAPMSLQRSAEDVRLVELARIALANQWRGFHTEDLDALLHGKHYDPIMGILGLHLLLMRPDPDLRSAASIHKKLRETVLNGWPHPDVEALGIEIARRRRKPLPSTPVTAPPMLRSSWAFLLKASTEVPYLIPSESFSSQIASRICGNGAWLAWLVPESKLGTSRGGEKASQVTDQPVLSLAIDRSAASKSATETSAPDFASVQMAMKEFLPSLRDLVTRHQTLDKLAKKAHLDSGEFTLLAFLYSSLQVTPLDPTATPPYLSLDILVTSLGIPADRVHQTMSSLLEKLQLLVPVHS